MSAFRTYPADGIHQLIIEEMVADGLLRGVEAAEIEITGDYDDRTVLEQEGEDTLRFIGGPVERVAVPPGIAVTVRQTWGSVRAQTLQADLTLEIVHGDLRLIDLSGVVRLAQVDGDIRADNVADFRLMGACDGDLRIEDCESFSAETVAGDIRLHDAGDVRLGRVRGDVWLDTVRGALQVGKADGDVRLNVVHGPAAVRGVVGDLRAGGLFGGLSAGQVNGDAMLSGPFTAPDGYQLAADGDIQLQLPAEADVRLTVRAGGRIRSDPALTPTTDGTTTYNATLGRGAVRITLLGGGDVRIAQPGARAGAIPDSRSHEISDFADLRNLGDQIRQQVTTSLAAAGIHTGPAGGRPRGARPPAPERPRSSATPQAPPPSLDEQVAILKMVESGQITPAEADVLLRALGA